jgi:hypothetical protein
MASADKGASAPASDTGLAKYVTEFAPADASGNCFEGWPACALVQLRKTCTGVKHWRCKFSLAENAELQQLANGARS